MRDVRYTRSMPDPETYFALFETTAWNRKYGVTAVDLERAIANSWTVCCAYNKDELVGFGRVISDGILYAMIYDMIVATEFRKKGIGSRILEELVEQCREAGIREVQLFSAEGKKSFYEKRGFRPRDDEAPGMTLTVES